MNRTVNRAKIAKCVQQCANGSTSEPRKTCETGFAKQRHKIYTGGGISYKVAVMGWMMEDNSNRSADETKDEV